MKKVFFLFAIISFMALQSCSGTSDFNPEGKWKAKDVVFDMDLKCDECPKEIMDEMKSTMDTYISDEVSKLEDMTFIEFTSDEKYKANINGESLDGTYSIGDGGKTIKLKVGNEFFGTPFEISKNDKGETTMSYKVPESDLKQMSQVQNVPGVGEMKFIVSKIIFTFVKDAVEEKK